MINGADSGATVAQHALDTIGNVCYRTKSMNINTFVFDRKLFAACVLTRHKDNYPEGTVLSSSAVQTLESVFLDGRIAVGSTPNIMTAVFDTSEAAGNNPTSPKVGKMPCEHAALHVSERLLVELTKDCGPSFVKIGIRPGSVDWFLGERHIEERKVINHFDNHDLDDPDEEDDCLYPDYEKLLKHTVKEVDRLRDVWEELEQHIPPSAFSVFLDEESMSTILQIAQAIGSPSRPATVRISGGTPDYNVVRYCTGGGLLRNDIVTILGARTTVESGEFSKFEVLPEFTLRKQEHVPFPIWDAYRSFNDDDDYTDDDIDDESLDDDE